MGEAFRAKRGVPSEATVSALPEGDSGCENGKSMPASNRLALSAFVNSDSPVLGLFKYLAYNSSCRNHSHFILNRSIR